MNSQKPPHEGDYVRVYDSFLDETYYGTVTDVLATQFVYRESQSGPPKFCFYTGKNAGKWEKL